MICGYIQIYPSGIFEVVRGFFLVILSSSLYIVDREVLYLFTAC